MTKYISFVVLALGLFVSSCTDKLAIDPEDSLDKDLAFKRPSDFTNALKGSYLFFRSENLYGGNALIVGDLLADDLITSSEGRGSWLSIHRYNISSNNTWSGAWASGYRAVSAANNIIENIDVLEDGEFKDATMGEALAIRGFAHFMIAQVYTEYPPFAAADDLGIPYITTTDPTLKPTRPANSETWDNIIADLVQAEALLIDNEEIGRIDKTVVNGLLSRIYLYTHEYDKAETAATKAIDAGADLAVLDELALVWLDEIEKDVLFKISVTEQDQITPGVVYSQSDPSSGIRSEYVPAYPLFDSYSDDDVRKSIYFITDDFSSKSFNNLTKWVGRDGGSQNVVDSKVIRWAEVYLNRAEARAMQNDDAGALADLNTLRSNRYNNFTPGTETGQTLVDEIFMERRKELVGEGHRFWDLKRRGESVARPATGDESNGSGLPIPDNARNLDRDDYRFTLPIPISEINANPNMEQNPGY